MVAVDRQDMSCLSVMLRSQRSCSHRRPRRSTPSAESNRSCRRPSPLATGIVTTRCWLAPMTCCCVPPPSGRRLTQGLILTIASRPWLQDADSHPARRERELKAKRQANAGIHPSRGGLGLERQCHGGSIWGHHCGGCLLTRRQHSHISAYLGCQGECLVACLPVRPAVWCFERSGREVSPNLVAATLALPPVLIVLIWVGGEIPGTNVTRGRGIYSC